MAKTQYRPKVKYINEVQHFDFKEHSMISIPIKINPETGYGESMSMGVSKAAGILNPKNLIALRKFVQTHEDELRTIKDDAHLKPEEGGNYG